MKIEARKACVRGQKALRFCGSFFGVRHGFLHRFKRLRRVLMGKSSNFRSTLEFPKFGGKEGGVQRNTPLNEPSLRLLDIAGKSNESE